MRLVDPVRLHCPRTYSNFIEVTFHLVIRDTDNINIPRSTLRRLTDFVKEKRAFYESRTRDLPRTDPGYDYAKIMIAELSQFEAELNSHLKQ
jgi:hypothetical protein